MRNIIVFSTETNEKKEISTSATTWGALKQELSAAGFSVNNMKGMVKETKTTLESDGAVLPSETFTLFITPSKVKSGAATTTKKVVAKRVTKTAPVKKAPAKKLAPAKKASAKVARPVSKTISKTATRKSVTTTKRK